MANSFLWLTVEDIRDIHDDQIRRFGGAEGLKSQPLLESAAAAPLNHFSYGGEVGCLRLGAVLAHAIVKDHPFVDGNKRTAAVALLEFLYINGLTIDLPDTVVLQPLASLVEQLAASELSWADFAEHLRPSLTAV